jgi:selenocysteine lyase/cysteine desulfurase
MVDAAIDALAETARSANPQPGKVDPGELATDQLHWRVRKIVSDFVNSGDPGEISFHSSATHALFNLAFSLRSILNETTNLVVTDLDHLSNVCPWEDVWGRERGCEIRRARVKDEENLDLDHLTSLVDGKTGLVAITMASNAFGSVVPLTEAIHLVKERAPECLVCVDAVHHAFHGSIDVQEMDCDFLTFSGYKAFGPVIGVLWGRRHLLDRLEPYRVDACKNEVPHKLEQGTLNNALVASLEGALQYLLWLGQEVAGDSEGDTPLPGDRFRIAMKAIEGYEGQLSRSVLEGFQAFDAEEFRCFGVTNPERISERDPTFLFEINDHPPREIKRYLWEKHAIHIAEGEHYSAAVHRHLGRESLCRASFAHYDTLETANLFVAALGELIESSTL